MAADNLKNAILKNLTELNAMSAEEILQDRYDKFRVMGEFEGSVE